MKFIPLTQSKQAIIDDEDFDRVNQHKWYLDYNGYVIRAHYVNKKRKVIYLHRFIMDFPRGLIVDHKSGNKLDCRKDNLRICTIRDNVRNATSLKSSKSGVKGVHPTRSKLKPWRANIKVDYRNISLGQFVTKVEAINAYNEAAIKYFGEFARLNILP